jgi:hypothetical protein
LPGFPLTVGDFIARARGRRRRRRRLHQSGADRLGQERLHLETSPAPFNQNAAHGRCSSTTCSEDGLYKYRIDSPTDVGPGDVPAGPPPAAAFLAQNTPNPFNPTTKIAYGIPANAGGVAVPVRLEIFDAAGHRCATW